MIFKRWFKPKWQHQDAAIRQLAIAELDHQTPQQKEILHELAFNDGAEAVRRAALERLNEFSLWWQASKHESAERLKNFAEQQLIQMLLENRVSSHLKQQFIAECNRTSVLEQLATNETDAQIKFLLLQRLNRQDLIVQALIGEVLTVQQKQQLIADIADEKVLEKLHKQLAGELSNLVLARLEAIREAKAKPERIRKQVVLFLAKLNAIREKSDVVEANEAFEQGKIEWQALSADLTLLADHAEFTTKFEKIIQLTEASLAPKLAAARELQAQLAEKQRAEKDFQNFNQQLNLLEQQLGAALAEADLDTAGHSQAALDALATQINAAQLNSGQLQQLSEHIAKIQAKLNKLPELAESLALSARLIAELSAQSLPVHSDVIEAHQGFMQWQKSFKAQMKALGPLMPANFVQSYQTLVEQWQQHCEPLLAEQQKNFKQLKSKFAEFKRLYDAGKYNVLFGLFKGIEQQFEQLPEQQQQQLASDKENAAEIIAKLADLQAYIATPRKQQLLAQMQALISDDSYSMPDRAAQIKKMRADWNSLGRAEGDLEQQLNTDFNTACEAAFAPCRVYFSELDAQRAEAATKKTAVIAELAQAVENNLSGKALDQCLQQQTKAWEQAGMLEKSVYAVLQPQYSELVSQLKQRQSQEQKANAQQKQQLVEKAATLLASLESVDVVAAVKELQAQWTATGFAGRKLDQQLWQQFRQHCDELFAKRQELRQQQQQLVLQQRENLSAQFQQLVDKSANAIALVDLSSLLAELQEFQSVEAVKSDRQLTQAARDLRNTLNDKIKAVQVLAEKSEYLNLFNALEQSEVEVSQLPSIYRVVFNQQQEKLLTRADLTLALEWAAGVNSPDAEQKRRQEVQMLLLTDKHNSGSSYGMTELLGRWLQFGPVTAAERELFTRVKRLFVVQE